MKKLLLFMLLFCAVNFAFAQTARVQVIHNSPSPTVDIYANGDLLLDNFAFRTATPFVDLPAGVNIDLGVALANSTSAADALVNFDVQFEADETYVVMAAGVVGGAVPFDLKVTNMGVETADQADNVGIAFFHGATDAPEVDVLTGGNVLFDDIEFGEFANYLNVPASSYQLDVTPANDNATIVASYQANLDFWGGRTAVVFASGFFSGDAPAFEPWVALDNGGTFPLSAVAPPMEPGARLQIIHNSPTPTVDVYVNDALLLDNFAFRTATPFIDVPSDVNLTVSIALANSTSSADALVSYDLTLAQNATYIAVANGIVGGNPSFNLEIFDMGEETANDPANVGLVFFHGSPDAPEVDIIAGGNPIFDDVAYTEFQGYLNVPAGSYELGVTPANDNSNVLATYAANFDFWAGRTAVVFASGFLGGDEPGFEPWVALDNGGTFPLSPVDVTPPPTPETARLQVIHNSPTPTVDVYVNGGLLLDNFVFRTATPFIDVPAGVDLEISIAAGNSQSVDDAIVSYDLMLMEGATYVAIANGVVGGMPGFNLEIFDMGMETADNPNNVGLLFFHGSPDAPEVDITVGGNPIFDDVSFGEFSGYLNVPAASYDLSVTPGNDNSNVLATYGANFDFWAGKTAVVFASGYLGGDFPAFEPWVALSTGGTFPLSPSTSMLDGAVQNRNATTQRTMLYPNPASTQIDVQIELAKESEVAITILNVSGQIVRQENPGTMYQGMNKLTLGLEGLAEGLYFVRIDNGVDTQIEKFTILR